MRWLVGLCVRYAGTLATLTLIALAAGFWATRSAPLDVFPDFVPSTVDIQTEAPGFTAQQVEQLVTKPIENAVGGAPGLATLRSESIPGLSLVTIQFRDNIDLAFVDHRYIEVGRGARAIARRGLVHQFNGADASEPGEHIGVGVG